MIRGLLEYRTKDYNFSVLLYQNLKLIRLSNNVYKQEFIDYFQISNYKKVKINNFQFTIPEVSFQTKKELIYNINSFYNSINKEFPGLILYSSQYTLNNKYNLTRYNNCEWRANLSDNYLENLQKEKNLNFSSICPGKGKTRKKAVNDIENQINEIILTK